jgi:diadenosine tetraphosphatase ApaH/serine/threonine PP2A family protein phosphatase
MKIAFISDIHSNLEAFQAVIASLARYDVAKVMFLGDIVGYGANPNECIDLLRGIADCNIAGNHDSAAVDKTDISNFNPYAQEAVLWTKEVLTRQNALFLSSLPLTDALNDFMVVHSSPLHPELWDYVVSFSDAQISFRNFTQQLCFIGHSHHPGIFILDRTGTISAEEGVTMNFKEGNRYITNIGSVGQPRDGNPLSAYGMYDTETNEYRLIRVEYNIALAQQKILAAGLPRFLAERLSVGR